MAGRALNRSGQTSATLILIGLILQVVEVVIALAIGLFFLIVPILGGIVLALTLVGVVWVVLVYVFSYQRTTEGDYEGARTPTLVFAILSLLTLGLISGILYIIAYVKLEDAAQEALAPPMGWSTPPPAPVFPMGQRFCSYCGQPIAVQATFCSRCGARLQ